MAATLVDSMDTLWMLGMRDAFQRARDYVASSLRFDMYVTHTQACKLTASRAVRKVLQSAPRLQVGATGLQTVQTLGLCACALCGWLQCAAIWASKTLPRVLHKPHIALAAEASACAGPTMRACLRPRFVWWAACCLRTSSLGRACC